MKQRVVGWLAVFGMLVVMGSAAAAQSDFPAYLLLNGYLHRWTAAEGLTRVEACDLPDTRMMRLSLSPDGRFLALNLVAEDLFDVGPHGDLYWCDPVSGEMRQLTQGNLRNTSTARRGTWSPDGTRLGWTQVNPDSETAAIHLYDPAADEVIMLVENTPLPYGCGVGPVPPQMSWSSAGIAVPYWISTAEDVCSAEQVGVYVYDATSGALIADVPIATADSWIRSAVWVTSGGAQLLVSEGETQYLISLDGTITPTSGGVEWVLAASGEPIRSILPFEGSAIGAAPDGSTALTLIETNLYTVVDGTLEVIDLTTAEVGLRIREGYPGHDIAWAALRPQMNAALSNAAQCSLVEPLFFFEGQNRARVISGMGANNLRLAPFGEAEMIDEIPEGGEMEVVFGTHICNGGIVWRYVRYAGVTGWTAESQGETAYLERIGG